MDKTGTETTPSRGLYGAIGGAGGKMRKPPSRKPQTTPYSRPPPAEKRRWLSSIVDPAYRLISGGATRLFPSLFSPESSVAALQWPEVVQFHDASGDEHNLDTVEAEEHNIGGDESNLDSNNGVARITEAASTSRAQNSSKHGSDFDGHEAEKSNDLSDISGLSEIEQLLKGKQFSRDEANRLMEIIQSKAVQLPTVEHDKGKQSLTVGGEAKEPATTHDVTKTPSTENHKDMSKATWGTATPLPQSAMRDEVSASPVNIARAYMGSRKLDVDISCSKVKISEDERKMLNSENFALTPFIPASTPKKSTCWPGSMAKDQRDYSESGRVGLHNFPRTPYSRTIFSTSKSKRFTPLQGGKDNSPSITPSRITPSTHLNQLQTPVYGQPDALDGGYGSAGPIRRTRHKFAAQTPARGSPYVYSSQIGMSQVENSKFSKEYLPSEKKNFELGGLSGNSRFQSIDRKPSSFQVGVHPQSSQIARSILEHIDRNSPTPKDKSEELRLSIGWKKPISSDSPSLNQNGDDSALIGGFSSRKVINHDYQKMPALESVDKWRSLFKVPPPKNTLKATEVTSNGIAGDESDGRSLVKSTNEDFPKTALNVGSDVSTQPQMKPAFEPSGTKCFFPSISIDKPESKWVLPSDKSSAFTFPVSTSPAVFSEPPTPSIMPSFSTSNEYQPKDGDSVPIFNFGSKMSDRLAFTFPYTSDAVQHDTSDIKFSFGSDKPRLSFEDAVCF